MQTTTLECNDYSTWPCKGGMYPKCLQMLWKQDLFQNYIFFDEMSSDHRRTWKKWLSSIYLTQLLLLLCILQQALPGINALKEFESSNSGMHSMKPICNRKGKKITSI